MTEWPQSLTIWFGPAFPVLNLHTLSLLAGDIVLQGGVCWAVACDSFMLGRFSPLKQGPGDN